MPVVVYGTDYIYTLYKTVQSTAIHTHTVTHITCAVFFLTRDCARGRVTRQNSDRTEESHRSPHNHKRRTSQSPAFLYIRVT